ncbi:hypothetical protein ACKTG8_001995 [Cronobacter sakazakii]|uniref:hypothetical protein n=1 Tax=Cronobacter sakazakii TaxID=28141 RepID=UPI000AB990A9|nr:hypothetical protein [Cronobacter sakazakii]MDK1078204.1 hypothetical protein [Cronobacter sakazakii]MDK1332482.1 hypothetical protein [Cronobacter sakazakii]
MANLMEVIITPLYPADDGVMPGAYAPDRFLCAVIQAGRLAVRQADVKMRVKLAVGKDLYIHFPDAIYQRAAVKIRSRH